MPSDLEERCEYYKCRCQTLERQLEESGGASSDPPDVSALKDEIWRLKHDLAQARRGFELQATMHALPSSDPRRASLELLQSPLNSGVPGFQSPASGVHGVVVTGGAPRRPPPADSEAPASWGDCIGGKDESGEIYLPHHIEGLDEDRSTPGGLLLYKPEASDVDAPHDHDAARDAIDSTPPSDASYTLCGMTSAFQSDDGRGVR